MAIGATMISQSSTEVPSPVEYRAFADECLRWANKVRNQEERNTLLEIARTWMQAALKLESAEQAERRATTLPAME
jgi:hypothetical protein